jgi:exonuclease VII small subunit
MTDATTIAELSASWTLAVAALVGVLWERAKRKADEESLEKLAQAVAQLEGVVSSLNSAVVELQGMRGAISRGVDLAAQATKLQAVNMILRGIDVLRDWFG